jgi:hypothetical protein
MSRNTPFASLRIALLLGTLLLPLHPTGASDRVEFDSGFYGIGVSKQW